MNTGRVSNVVDLLYREDGLANQEIAEAFGLAPSTVTELVRELSERGLIESLDAEHYPAHRKQENRRNKALLRPKAEYGVLLAVDVTPNALRTRVVDFSLGVEPTVAAEHRRPDPEFLEAHVQSVAGGVDSRPLRGVGIAVSGTVDPVRNVLSSSIHLPSLVERQFADRLAETLAAPVVLVNDAHAIAIGHRYRGLGRDRDDFIGLYIADGVGAGIYADGRLYRGWDNRAGELGSMVIDPDGEIGVSGRRGCFEDAVSRIAIHRRMQDLALRGVQSAAFEDSRFEDSESIFVLLREYFEAHDGLVRTLVDDLATRIGLVAANVSAAFSPERILLSGPLAELGYEFLELVRGAFTRFAVSLRAERIEEHLCLDTKADEMKAIGAAKAAVDRHLSSL